MTYSATHFNQSISQPTNQLLNQWINRSFINPSINQQTIISLSIISPVSLAAGFRCDCEFRREQQNKKKRERERLARSVRRVYWETNGFICMSFASVNNRRLNPWPECPPSVAERQTDRQAGKAGRDRERGKGWVGREVEKDEREGDRAIETEIQTAKKDRKTDR